MQHLPDPEAMAIGEFVLKAFGLFLVNLVMACFACWLAEQKGYRGGTWFWLTALFSILAFFTVIAAPNKKVPNP